MLNEIACPSCKTEHVSHYTNTSKFFTCSVCFKHYRFIGNNIIYQGEFKRSIPNVGLNLGDKFNYLGNVFLVAGMARALNSKYNFYWNEYFLVGAYDKGIKLYLSNYGKHWNILTQINESEVRLRPSIRPSNAIYKNTVYRLFSDSKSFYTASVGDFDVSMIFDKNKNTKDFIKPPYSILIEYVNEEKYFFHATYHNQREIESLFKKKLSTKSTPKNDIYPNQPNPISKDFSNKIILNTSFSLIILLLFTFLFYVSRTASDTIINEQILFSKSREAESLNNEWVFYSDSFSKIQNQEEWDDSETKNHFISKPFQLNSFFGTSALEFELNAPELDNNWLSCEVTMLNVIDGEEYSVDLGCEYYSGISEGVSWSEGDKSQSKIISQVPDGNYRIIISPILEDEYEILHNKNSSYFRLSAKRKSFILSNFFIALLMISAFPILILLYMDHFEHKRWKSSE